jgi:hypothetical protein
VPQRQGRTAAAYFTPRSTAPGGRMNIHLSLTPLISLLAGILILVMPKLLNFIVAIYLIAIGLIGLFGTGALHLS